MLRECVSGTMETHCKAPFMTVQLNYGQVATLPQCLKLFQLSLLEASRAQADVMNQLKDGFRYPSYVEVYKFLVIVMSRPPVYAHDATALL